VTATALSRRARARAAVVAAVLVALPAVPEAGAAPVRQILAGRSVLVADRPAAETVVLPRAATIDLDDATADSPSVTIEGTGRLAGFVLTALDPSDAQGPRTLIMLRVGGCTAPRCEATAPRQAYEYAVAGEGFAVRRLSENARRVTLPAGDYALRAVTDGAPVRLTLRLGGLAGATTVRVTRAHRVTLRTDASPPGPARVDPLRNVAASYRFGRVPGLTFHVLFQEYEPHVRSISGICYYRDAAPPTGRYHPGCPNSVGESVDMVGYPTLRFEGLAFGADIMLLPGTWTVGHYLTGVGGASSLTVVTLFLDLV
jgi:hypothetical protein